MSIKCKHSLFCLFFIVIGLFVNMNLAFAATVSSKTPEEVVAFLEEDMRYHSKDYGANLCLGYISDVFGKMGFDTRYGLDSAISYWNILKNEGKAHYDDLSDVPIGADVFFDSGSNFGSWGHVGIYVGDGYIIHNRTLSSSDYGVCKQKISDNSYYTSCYLGWAWHDWVTITPKPATYELDVNGWTDNTENYWVGGYATFDMYLNGSKVADDVDDFWREVESGTSYEIKDIKVASGKAFDGYSSYIRSGFNTSGGRTGTVNSNTDVRLTLHILDAAAYTRNYSPAAISIYNGHTYYLYDRAATWYGSQIVSDYLGGHLVTITSAAENSFVKGMIGDSACWTGATDKDNEGTWKWITNETFSYSNWFGVEPNNDSGNDEGSENYVHIRAGASDWNDSRGNAIYPFICEIDRVYTLTYNANGGSGAPSAQTKAVGQDIKLSSTIPTKTDCEFLGWATSSTASTPSYQPSGTYSQDQNTTFYAVWKSLRYTLSFNMNGGNGSVDPITINDGSPCTIPSTVPTRTGYDFLGWSKSNTASTATYKAGNSYPGGTATLYAVWKIKNYTVSFDSNGAGSYDSVRVNHGNTIPSLPVPEKRGFFFKGWFSGNTQVTTSTAITSNLTLVARWSEPTVLKLPAALTTIEDEAFMGTAPNVVVLSDKVRSVGSKAFANNADLYTMIVYTTSIAITNDSFVNCPNLTVYGYADTMIEYYCTAKNIPFVALGDAGWISEDELPIGANVTAEKWAYTQSNTETTTSTETSLPGWAQTGEFTWKQTGSGTWKYASYPGGFDTNHGLYSKYNKSALTASTAATTKREVSSSSFLTYIYWHWCFTDWVDADHGSGGHNVNIEDAYKLGVNIYGSVYRDFTYFMAFETTEDQGTIGPRNASSTYDIAGEGGYYFWRNNPADASQWWWRFNVYQQTYTDSQKEFTFTRTVTEEKESNVQVTEGNGISNVRRLVKYSF